jgi:hypothetical protein
METIEGFADLDNQSWDMGVGKSGVHSTFHVEDKQLIIAKQYDAQPLVDACAEARATGKRGWGEGRVFGSMPPNIFNQLIREGKAFDQKYVTEWFRQHPQFLRVERL